MKLNLSLFILFNLSLQLAFGTPSNEEAKEVNPKDTVFELAADDAILQMIDSLMADRYYCSFTFVEDTAKAKFSDSSFVLVDSVLESRLAALDQKSPFDLRYNQYTKAFINLYVNKKRDLSQSVLGLAPRYFPMFEEILDQYQMPLELKYLAVVESALSPSARSRVGAQGLWQFMYRTGRMYGLKVDSYIDERMDPFKATHAACAYMSDLYKMYGDWSLVLAAYNSGPGNVNKAIRRSGGIKDYWKIRRFLPRETRGYVPAFIAVNYMMNYSTEYELYPKELKAHAFDIDTIHLRRNFSYKILSDYLGVDEEEIAYYNPQYKLSYIPAKETPMPLCLKVEDLGVYLTNERTIYADIRKKEIEDSIAGVESTPVLPPSITHYVRSGEFLGYIAEKYHVSVRNIMEWNNLRSSRLDVGDKLILFTKNGSSTVAQKSPAKEPSTEKKEVITAPKDQGSYQFHTVKNGDTLWDIAKRYENTSVNDLKRLNSGLNFRRLKPGMRVKVKEIG